MTILQFPSVGDPKESRDPWVKDSIYRLIKSSIDQTSGQLPTHGLDLPDENSVRNAEKIGWVAGARDGVAGVQLGERQKVLGKRAAELLGKISETADCTAASALYRLLKEESVLDFVDEALRCVAEKNLEAAPHLHEVALKLATEAADRGPVKFGIALLGTLRLRSHQDVVCVLGRHDEFTLFAAVALRNMLDDPETAIWSLAKLVRGWGRIQAVNWLVPTASPEIQRWLRTDGFRNSVMHEYLAYIAATNGRLAAALELPLVEDAELASAGEIIDALIAGSAGPVEGIDQYEDAAKTCRLYLSHVKRHSPVLCHFLTTQLIREYIEGDERPSDQRLKQGWSESAQNSVRALCANILENEQWNELVLSELNSGEDRAFHRASRAAEYLGLDTFECHWARLKSQPQEAARWYYVMHRANPERIDQIIELAERELPLDVIATGPTDALGIGPGFRPHGCLDFVLQDLEGFPGKGWRLIDAGIRSPGKRNRVMALNALERWESGAWPPEVRSVLEVAHSLEPDQKLQERIDGLLQKSK